MTTPNPTLHDVLLSGIDKGLRDVGADLTGCTPSMLTGHIIKELRAAGLHPGNQPDPDQSVIDRASRVMQQHYLSGKTDADRNDFCVCGRWASGPMEPGWDDHLAEELARAGLLAPPVSSPDTLVAALELIDRLGCSKFTKGRCSDASSGLERGARYGADAWCDACIARDALDKAVAVSSPDTREAADRIVADAIARHMGYGDADEAARDGQNTVLAEYADVAVTALTTAGMLRPPAVATDEAAVELALVKAAKDFGDGKLIAGPSDALARAALAAVGGAQ